MNAYMNQYHENQIMTASREQILIMLYDGAIRFCRQAMAANNAGNKALKLEKSGKVLAIVTEFSNSLNHEIGGEIAENLDALYHFMTRELLEARKVDTNEHLKVVETLLVDLRQTWAEAIETNKREQQAVPKQPENHQGPQLSRSTISAAG